MKSVLQVEIEPTFNSIAPGTLEVSSLPQAEEKGPR